MCDAFASVWPDPSKALGPVNLGLRLCIAVVVLGGCTSQKDVALVDAALSGDLPKVQALLKQGADIEATAYEGSPAAIQTGARVTVWYRSVGERRFVADKVRVLTDAPTH